MKALVLLAPLALCSCMRFSKNVCPAPYEFSKQEQMQAAQEIQSLPQNSAVVDMLIKLLRNNNYLKGLK